MAPNFKAPFPSRQKWTFSHHSAEVRQALDFIRTRGSTAGLPVLASAAGRAFRKNQPGGAGRYIVINHGSGWQTFYFHLSSYSVPDGARVRQGQEIGRAGSTGASSGPHLHYEQLRLGVGQKIRIEGVTLRYPPRYGIRFLTSNNRLGAKSGGRATKAAKPAKPPVEPERVPYRKLPTLKRGDHGVFVFFLQWRLRRLGFAIDRLPKAPFGPQTEAAVKAFQEQHKTPKSIRPDGTGDGIVGFDTWVDIIARSLQRNPVAKRPVLKQRDSGMWVGYLQAVLRKDGHQIDDIEGFPFGPQTRRALAAFQARHRVGLRPDGKPRATVNAATWTALDARWHDKL